MKITAISHLDTRAEAEENTMFSMRYQRARYLELKENIDSSSTLEGRMCHCFCKHLVHCFVLVILVSLAGMIYIIDKSNPEINFDSNYENEIDYLK